MPTGVGEPVFDKLDALLAKAVMSIGAVKAVEIGDGISVVSKRGSENNDGFKSVACDAGDATSDAEAKTAVKLSNHSGGTLGGISDGSEIILRAAFKPTPSIFREQQTVTTDKEDTVLEIKGRHDPIIGPRAVVVVESMCAITILDLIMQNSCSTIDKLKKLYN